ncbi:MAG: hypothetical protein QNJ78_03625 [Gammaproteobacteria bacterium]|nr:hypothetical protein [Gammaproteobacteria bacterium]
MGSRVRKLFDKHPTVTDFLAPMRVRRAPVIHMQRFQTGIDNLHVDVVLSKRFRAVLSDLVRMMVVEDLSKQGYSIASKPLTKEHFDAFRDVYRDLLDGSLRQSHGSIPITDLVMLLQLSLLKVLLACPSLVINGLREQLNRDADLPARGNDGRSLELHERRVAIAKFEPGVLYRSLRRLFKAVQQMETGELRKIRKSVIGTSWVIPRQLLFNPLLHLPNLSIEAYLMNHYPIICLDRDHESFFAATNELFCEVFTDYLPEWAQPVGSSATASEKTGQTESFQVRDRAWRGGFSEFLDGHRLLEQSLQEEEFKELRYSWLDTPNNIDLLFQQSQGTQWFKGIGGRNAGNASAKQDVDWAGFQKKTVNTLLKRLEKTGILRRAIASYRTPRLYHQLHERVPVRDIYQYLSGIVSRRSMIKRLNGISPNTADESIRALDTVVNYLRHIPTSKQEEYASRYLRDFLTFRRDLKLAHFAYQQMSYIRLLEDTESINLSKDNATLYEFRLGSETGRAEEKIRSHVVLKADIRGSTEITHQLMQKRLNPATHFSLNFFGPINKLLERFNTQKVFVEGDALILTVLEYTGMAGNQALTVAYACGLACKIISVMEAQNQQNRAHGLPKLELGLGISFSGESPAYLYDDRRKIMISPAINQADRLSSCAAELRKNNSWKRNNHHAVEVMQSAGKADTKQKLLRYNVNGIDLDPPAFEKLRSEISMHKVPLSDRSNRYNHYYAGRFIDRLGTSHWLVVREGPIKTLSAEGSVVESPGDEQVFYEVITSSDIIGKVKSKLRSRRKSSGMQKRRI